MKYVKQILCLLILAAGSLEARADLDADTLAAFEVIGEIAHVDMGCQVLNFEAVSKMEMAAKGCDKLASYKKKCAGEKGNCTWELNGTVKPYYTLNSILQRDK